MKKLAGAVNCRYLLSLLLSILFAFLIFHLLMNPWQLLGMALIILAVGAVAGK